MYIYIENTAVSLELYISHQTACRYSTKIFIEHFMPPFYIIINLLQKKKKYLQHHQM